MSRLILIVDDREDDRYLLERHIRKVGVTNPIQQSSDGDKAIQYLSQDHIVGQPITLFLDLKMPRVDGFCGFPNGSVIIRTRMCSSSFLANKAKLPTSKRSYSLGARST